MVDPAASAPAALHEGGAVGADARCGPALSDRARRDCRGRHGQCRRTPLGLGRTVRRLARQLVRRASASVDDRDVPRGRGRLRPARTPSMQRSRRAVAACRRRRCRRSRQRGLLPGLGLGRRPRPCGTNRCGGQGGRSGRSRRGTRPGRRPPRRGRSEGHREPSDGCAPRLAAAGGRPAAEVGAGWPGPARGGRRTGASAGTGSQAGIRRVARHCGAARGGGVVGGRPSACSCRIGSARMAAGRPRRLAPHDRTTTRPVGVRGPGHRGGVSRIAGRRRPDAPGCRSRSSDRLCNRRHLAAGGADAACTVWPGAVAPSGLPPLSWSWSRRA